ncbi:unnamed protein product [Adineta ricciae]|nr:unnamed protein product [Adineta ricciae]
MLLYFSFDKKSRAIRRLYSVLYGDTRYITNPVHILIKTKNIYMNGEQQKQHQSISNSLSTGPTTHSTQYSSQSRRQFHSRTETDVNSLSAFLLHINSFCGNQLTESKSLKRNHDSKEHLSSDTNESKNSTGKHY